MPADCVQVQQLAEFKAEKSLSAAQAAEGSVSEQKVFFGFPMNSEGRGAAAAGALERAWH